MRTDPDAPKHLGISYLLVDMHSPGITIRPLILSDRRALIQRSLYDNVRVPRENVVGEINRGMEGDGREPDVRSDLDRCGYFGRRHG